MVNVFEDHRRYRVVKTITTLMILAILYIPILVFAKLKYYLLGKKRAAESKKDQTIVITGAKMYKSAMLVKWLGKAGYRIILVETEKFWCSGTRFSKYVDKFHTVACALNNPDQYVTDMLDLCKHYNADWFIPVCAPATEALDAIVGQELQSLGVNVLHAPSDIFKKLNDKHQFSELCKEHGLRVPESFIVECEQDAFDLNETLRKRLEEAPENEKYKHKFVLKNIDFDPCHRLDMFMLPCSEVSLEQYLKKIAADGTPVTAKTPWQVQRYIEGTMWSALQVQVNGRVSLFTSTYATASCFTWWHLTNYDIAMWMEQFAQKVKVTGMFMNDFIVDRHDGLAYAIECNPRLGSNVSLFHQNSHMADVILGQHKQEQVRPVTKGHTYTTLNEVMVLLDPDHYADEERNQNVWLPGRIKNFYNLITTGSDPIFDEEDLLPFFMINFFQVPMLLLDTFVENKPWKKIDFQIGKVVELGGY